MCRVWLEGEYSVGSWKLKVAGGEDESDIDQLYTTPYREREVDSTSVRTFRSTLSNALDSVPHSRLFTKTSILIGSNGGTCALKTSLINELMDSHPRPRRPLI